VGAQLAGTPVLCGSVPPIAYPYHQRPETGPGLTDGLRPGETIILTSGGPAGFSGSGAPGSGVPGSGAPGSGAPGSGAPGSGAAGSGAAGSGACGTGKTQLAIAFTHVVWNAQAVDLLVWVPASSRQSIITAFAQAAGAVDTDIPGETALGAAQRFLAWLSRTARRWAVVIDDLRDAADLADLWPVGPTGQTVVTTRLPGEQLAALGRQIVQVDAYTSREALAYLNARFVAQPDQRIEALDLAEDLGRLPLAISLAANYIADREESCRDYRPRYAERYEQVKDAATAECPANVLAAWSLAIEWAHELDPASLAWPAIALAAMGDHNGIPSAVLSSRAACEYITGRPAAAGAADQNMVRAVFDNLARLGLISVDTVGAARAITMHSAFRLAVLRYLPPADVEQVVTAAAAAILETWPDQALDPQLDQALRDSTASLQAFAGDLLWKPEAHPLLFRAGRSLEGALLADSAISFWQEMTDTATRLLGPGHMQAVQSRDRLAAAYEAAGRLGDANAVFESALADREPNLGADHQDTLTTRLNTAHSYQAAGRGDEAIGMYEQALADCERALGPLHADTLAARANLASAYHSAGQMKNAISAWERSLADRERAIGTDHPDTLAARAALANSYRAADMLPDAIPHYERVVSGRDLVQGPDHPDTLAARANLAYAYRTSGRLNEAIPLYEHALEGRERAQGPQHRDTLTARGNLAAAYHLARRWPDAIRQYERAVADSERTLGPGDIDTLTTRCNLATAYYSAGALAEAVAVLERALADCEHFLGPHDPMTNTVRENLRGASRE
jgi:tetratricopeptide (TPR) repeat protein